MYAASNGDVYPCLTLMDDPARRVAAYSGGRVIKLISLLPGGDRVHDFCHFIKMQSDGRLPLCIFYKDRLNFDRREKVPDGGEDAVRDSIMAAAEGRS